MREPIFLHLEIIDGKKHVFDQHGREIEGLISITSESCVNYIDTLTLKIEEMRDSEAPVISGGHQ